MRLPRKKILVPAAVGAALVMSAVAFAAWTASGSGTATASAGTAQTLSIDSPSTATGLYPTGAVDVQVRVTNPNQYAVTVTEIKQTAGQAISVDSGHSTCDVTSVTFDDAGGANLNLRVPAGASATTTLTSAVAMSNAANDACQGATFTVPLSLTGASSS